MGINYYVAIDTCSHCGRPERTLHIGKSSRGWVFALHVGKNEDDATPRTWCSWLRLLTTRPVHIYDEDGTTVTLEQLKEIVLERVGAPGGHTILENTEFDARLFLYRHKIDDRHCLAHGSGSYDLITGDFS